MPNPMSQGGMGFPAVRGPHDPGHPAMHAGGEHEEESGLEVLLSKSSPMTLTLTLTVTPFLAVSACLSDTNCE